MHAIKSWRGRPALVWAGLITLIVVALGLGYLVLSSRGHTVYLPRVCNLLDLLDEAQVQAEESHVTFLPEFPVAGETRPVLYTHPTSSVTFSDLDLHEEPRLEFGLGMHQDAWGGPGDGVHFEIVLQDERGRQHVVFSQEIDPVHNEQERRWIDVSLDLSDFERQTVALTFRTDPRGNPLNDWAAWSDPQLLSQEPLRVGQQDQPNVILISIDTLRADHLSSYGYERATTPNLDALAQGGVLFEQAYCQAALTTPSHASMLSSLYPRTHQLYENGFFSQEVRTLPQILKEQDYSTAAVVGVKFMLPQFSGLGQGFDTFFPFPEEDNVRAERRAGEVTDLAISWVEEHYRDKFFLWLHYYDPHWPYAPLAPYDTLFYQDDPYDPNNHSMDSVPAERRRVVGDVTDLAHPIAQYDGEIAYTDAQIGRLLRFLETMALDDNTLIVVVADHGESFTEHKVYFEHWALYDETIHVPMILRYPEHLPAGQRVSGMVEAGVDIVPTVLELLELSPLPEAEGRSLLSIIEGQESAHERVFSEQRNALAVSVRTEQQKFILHRASSDVFPWHPMREGKRELYDLLQDPAELINLLERGDSVYVEEGDHFARLCETWLNSAALQIDAVEREQDPELEEILKELGY